MIMFTMNAETKAAVVAALTAHGTDRLAVVGLGRIARENSALAAGSLMMVWPADDDGLHRVSLSDVAALIAWRAFLIAEIVAGRGQRDKHLARYEAAFGITTSWAFRYVIAATKGFGIRPCSDGHHDYWSEGTWFVVLDGVMDEPRKRWARSAWRQRAKAHAAFAAAGLAIRGRSTWNPKATCLFEEPDPIVPAPKLAPIDDDALTRFVA